MKARFANWLFNWFFARYPMQRRADFVIGMLDDVYLFRWYVFGAKPNGRSRSFLGHRAYLHCFRRSDDDRALHDHPSYSLSVGLFGSGGEHTVAQGGIHHRRSLKAGDIRIRSASFAHRIEINNGEYWTLFIFGPNFREWGFHCPAGWVPWKKFTATDNPGAIGAGCGE